MVLTRQQKADVIVHIFQKICGLEPDSDLQKAVIHERIKDVESLLSLSVLEIQDLTFKDGTTTNKVRKGDHGIVYALIAFSLKRDADENSINDTWTNTSKEEFDKYRVSPVK